MQRQNKFTCCCCSKTSFRSSAESLIRFSIIWALKSLLDDFVKASRIIFTRRARKFVNCFAFSPRGGVHKDEFLLPNHVPFAASLHFTPPKTAQYFMPRRNVQNFLASSTRLPVDLSRNESNYNREWCCRSLITVHCTQEFFAGFAEFFFHSHFD